MKSLILFVQLFISIVWAGESTCEGNVKVNSKGEYCLFPGITVVSSIGTKNGELWSKVYEALNKSSLIKRYYALLPLNSYHMTTINLFTKKNTSGNWNSFLEDQLPWFQKLNEKLKIDSFKPQVIKVEPEMFGQTIHLLIQLGTPQKEKIISLAKELSLVKKVPNRFHLTLGYLYRDISDKNRKVVKKEFKLLINHILNPSPDSIEFLEPKLCYFQDMLDFIPWDGKVNPFK